MTTTEPSRILLVEDEYLNRQLVTTILNRAPNPVFNSALVTEAATLGEARAALAAGPPFDVILLDIQLPDGSGLSLATELAATPPDQARPAVIALAAGARTDQRAAALAAGCDAMLTKPYAVADLEAVLTEYLPEARAADAGGS